MEAVLQAATIALAVFQAVTPLEVPTVVTHPVAFPVGVTPVASRVVAMAAEVADNRAHRYFQKRTFRVLLFYIKIGITATKRFKWKIKRLT